ncbi:MAG TPA: hypothetical protein VFG66_03240 [Gemmatimonadales bacterium]|nr:hypothetical protein [Gemmatimonadales bacterium]
MLARLIGCTALAALGAAAPTSRAPVTTKYRVDQTLTQDIDASSAGKGKQSLSFSTSSFVTLTFTDSTGGKTVRMVVDSMRGDSTAPVPAEVFDSAKGAEFRAFLSESGKLSELEAVKVSPAAERVQGFISDFFPWVKAGVKSGERWADTSSRATTDGTDSVVVRRVNSYRVLGKETRGARKAVRIASEYQSSVAGTQPTPNGPARIEGAGKGAGTYFVSSDGLYLGGDWQLRSALTISGAFADEPLPITITQTTKVTTLE